MPSIKTLNIGTELPTDFDGEYAGLLRVANFGQEMVASLVIHGYCGAPESATSSSIFNGGSLSKTGACNIANRSYRNCVGPEQVFGGG